MSKEKIKEMAKILCQNGFCNLEDWNGCKLHGEEYCSACIHIAERLYNVGYRKQSEGEWEYHGCVSSYDGLVSGYCCTCCDVFIREEVYDTLFPAKFCPNCGAHMRMEDEGK